MEFYQGKYRIPLLKIFIEDRNNKFIEKQISEIKPPILPLFYVCPFNMPHALIFLDSAGNYLSNAQMFDPLTYYNKPAFLSYLKHANEK
jgi:hypothetical protein